jgi:hypothetical protein
MGSTTSTSTERLSAHGFRGDAIGDPKLTPAMTALGVAIQEESTLGFLLADRLSS